MNAEEAARKIRELEEALRQEKAKSAEYKATAYALLNQVFPHVPATPEEIEKLKKETDGTPIRQVVAELQQESAR